MKKKIPQDLIRLLRKYGIATPDQDKEYTVSELNQLIDQVDRLIEQKKKRRLEIPNQGNKRLLALLAQIVLLAINTAAVTLAESGIGPVPAKNDRDKKISKDLTFDVVAHMIVGSNLLTTLFAAIAGMAEANEKIQQIIAESLKLLSFLTVIRTATKGNEDRMISLVDDFSKEIEKSIDIIDNYLNEEIVTGNFSKRTSEELALKLHESKLALQKGEVDRFIKTCLGALDILDITPDLLAKNLKEIEELANTFSEAITSRDESPTALTQQAM